jgi:lipoprotein-anchoring transpeptidase ErfK/SrfK
MLLARPRSGRIASVAAVVLALGVGVVPAALASSGGPSSPRGPVVRPAPPKPTKPVAVTLTPGAGSVVGIGYPITAKFDTNVLDRAAAERHMPVLVNGRAAKGAWYWKDSRTALYRLPSFWPGHARISVRLSLSGVVLNHRGGFDFVGARATSRTYSFSTARAFVANINAKTDRMKVLIDGKLVRNIAVSLGKAGWETRSGIKTTMDKYVARRMTSQELGITDPSQAYDLIAPYATRITYSGEFIHGAPWATGRLGKWNGSHGCTNLSVADAKWFYRTTVVGDPVVTTGTTKSMEYWNSIGGVYNMPWKTWLAHSALKGRAA